MSHLPTQYHEQAERERILMSLGYKLIPFWFGGMLIKKHPLFRKKIKKYGKRKIRKENI